jgi:hypothetical protein
VAIRKCREDHEKPPCSKWWTLRLIMPNRNPAAESRRDLPKDRSADAEEDHYPRYDEHKGEA